MPTIRIQVALHSLTGLPEDVFTNTWHVSVSNTTLEADLAEVIAELDVFYNAIDTYLSSNISNIVTWKAFNLDDPAPRVPIDEGFFGITVSSATSLPDEVALCLSFQANRQSGQDQAHRRGRLFIGPLNHNAALTAAGPSRPSSAFVTALVAAADTFMTVVDNIGAPVYWAVYSPTLDADVEVDNGWVDNAFDTQRRRGLAPTSRTTWS